MIGANLSLTFDLDEMTRLKQIVLNADLSNKAAPLIRFARSSGALHTNIHKRP